MVNIVATGLGAVTPLGIGRDKTWEAMVQGKNGVGPITLFDPKAYGLLVGIDAEVKKWDPKTYIGWVSKKDLDNQHRSAQFNEFATSEAKKQAGLNKLPRIQDDYDIVNLVGTGGGGNDRYEEMTRAVDEGRHIHPPQLIQSIFNTILSSIAKTSEHDQAFPISTACATGADSPALLAILISNTANVVPCSMGYGGGAEAPISPSSIKGFSGIKALSRRNDPENSSRPFSKGRDGFVMGEGAVVGTFEDERFAKKRGAKPLARLIGWSSVCRSGHPTKPSPRDMEDAVSRAIRQAGILPEDIDAVIAHGTSTPLNDRIETLVLKKVLGPHAYKVPITAPRSMVGHQLGAAGATSFFVGIQSLITGILPPTINFERDPECDLDYTPNYAKLVNPRRVLVDAFGFGNQNCCLILERFEDWRV